MRATKRIHFVEGDLSEELDRLNISRSERCLFCVRPVPDGEVARLDKNEPDYNTVCEDCNGRHVDAGTEQSEEADRDV